MQWLLATTNKQTHTLCFTCLFYHFEIEYHLSLPSAAPCKASSHLKSTTMCLCVPCVLSWGLNCHVMVSVDTRGRCAVTVMQLHPDGHSGACGGGQTDYSSQTRACLTEQYTCFKPNRGQCIYKSLLKFHISIRLKDYI